MRGLGGSAASVDTNLVIIVWHGLARNASKACQADLRGTNDPDRIAAATSDAFPVRAHRVSEPGGEISTLRAGVHSEMLLDVLVQTDRCEADFHGGLGDLITLSPEGVLGITAIEWNDLGQACVRSSLAFRER
jgi:hypothetical protein